MSLQDFIVLVSIDVMNDGRIIYYYKPFNFFYEY